jgi:hypothetical protein
MEKAGANLRRQQTAGVHRTLRWWPIVALPEVKLNTKAPPGCARPVAFTALAGCQWALPFRSRTCECIPIPVPKTSLILLVSCPVRGRFLEAILQRTERKLAGPGRPGTVDGLVAGGALGGAAPSLGRARCLAARGGYVNPASKGAHWCPGASHRSIPSRGSRGTGKTRTQCAARTQNLGCLKFELGVMSVSAQHSQLSSPGLTGRPRADSTDRRNTLCMAHS